MATIFKGYRPRLARMMAAGNPELTRWMNTATFAKASTGHYMAWHSDDAHSVAVLPPGHPEGEECLWIEDWSGDASIDEAIRYVESGEFDSSDTQELNLWIQDPETGEWR